jgi:hypothetical protein
VRKSLNKQMVRQAGAPFFFGGPFRLGSIFLLAILASLYLATGSSPADALFQSPPESPVAPPEGEQAPPAEPSPAAGEGDVPAAPAPAESVSPDGNTQAAPTVAPGSQTSPPPAPTPLPAPQQQPVRPNPRTNDLDSADDSSLILDEAELVDTLVVSFAYVWLCCGIVLILLIPLVFLFMQIRGRSKINREG